MKKVLAGVFALVFVLSSQLVFAEEFNFNVSVKGMPGMDAPKKEKKASTPALKKIGATLEQSSIELEDGRSIPFKYQKSQTPWPNVEILEPVGAQIELYDGDKLLHKNEAPFLWKGAKIDSYVKMVVKEEKKTWSVKFQAKQLTNVIIGGKKAPASAAKPASKASSLKSKHFAIERAVFQAGDAVNVKFFGFPGNSQDWMNVVPVGAPNDEWGEWQYAGGKASGAFNIGGDLEPGKYELRAYYDYPAGGYAIQDRLQFTVK